MKILLVDNTETGDRQYNAPLENAIAQLTDLEVINYKHIPAEKTLQNRYSGIILSGVPLHYSFDSIHQRLPYIGWILHTHIPVLGICLGHESIGRLYGASVIHNTEAEDGTCALTIVHNDPIFHNIPLTFDIITSHRGSITVPNEFVLLASSEKCKNQIMKHKDKAIYGFQFHPESSDIGGTFLNNFIGITKNQQALPESLPPAEIADVVV
jgi:GMP synthase (glutamine-hydrolysing)